MMEQQGTLQKPGGEHAMLCFGRYFGPKNQLSSIFSPKLILCRAEITANLIILLETWRLNQWKPKGMFDFSIKVIPDKILEIKIINQEKSPPSTNIHWVLFEDAEVAKVKQPRNSKRRKFYYEKWWKLDDF